MTQIRNILAATDLSAPARHATARAARLAQQVGAELDLIHVLNQGTLDELRMLVGLQAEPIEQRILDHARQELARLAAGGETPAEPAAGLHLATGAVLGEVLKCADAVQADLLVLGARGESYMRHMLLGSTAERLLRKTSRPILVVKQTPIDAYRRVLVPLDFSPWSQAAIELAKAIAPRAELVLLHAFELPFEGKLRLAGVDEATISHQRLAAKEAAWSRLTEWGAASGLAATTRYRVLQGDPSRRIVEQEQEEDCDLIVLGKHGSNILEETLLGSVTKRVLTQCTCDLAICTVPPPPSCPSQ